MMLKLKQNYKKNIQIYALMYLPMILLLILDYFVFIDKSIETKVYFSMLYTNLLWLTIILSLIYSYRIGVKSKRLKRFWFPLTVGVACLGFVQVVLAKFSDNFEKNVLKVAEQLDAESESLSAIEQLASSMDAFNETINPIQSFIFTEIGLIAVCFIIIFFLIPFNAIKE